MTPSVLAAIQGLRTDCEDSVCAYVYDLASLQAHARSMRSCLPPGYEIYYAVKANAEAPILHTLAPCVDGFEAASGGELRWLHEQQPGRSLLFSGPGKLDSELRLAVSLPDCTVHVESLGELQRLARIAAQAGKTVQVFLRMNIAVPGMCDTRLMMGGKPTPFGLDEDALPQAMRILRENPQLYLQGFHFHLMSHQREVAMQLDLVKAYVDAAVLWRERYGVDVRTVNAGGGFGIDYANHDNSFDWQTFCRGLRDLALPEKHGLRIRFEPGRFVSVACGYYVMEVIDIKRCHGENFAVARGGTHHFRTPAAQNHDHPFHVLRGQGLPELVQEKVTLVGQLCTPKDVLARGQHVDSLAVGDCLLFPLAGAYAWNISHQHFLMHPPPRMIFLDTSKV